MKNSIIFSLPGNEKLTMTLSQKIGAKLGEAIIRHFPDEESYVRIDSDVKNKEVILVCSLDRPDAKLLPLMFMSKTAKQLGAKKVSLVVPYLAYMRQDRRFKSGEAITSEQFAALISQFADWMVTIDPHLHRRSSLSEIYSIPTEVVHAASSISEWIKSSIQNPVLIGPDSESEQWVSQVANDAEAPFLILEKIRHGDRDVEVSEPHLKKYQNYTPVLVDDIISTGRTMIETVGHLKKAGMKPPVCIGVHAVFADRAYEDLLKAGAEKVATCNTIPHPTNEIDISGLLFNCYNCSVCR